MLDYRVLRYPRMQISIRRLHVGNKLELTASLFLCSRVVELH